MSDNEDDHKEEEEGDDDDDEPSFICGNCKKEDKEEYGNKCNTCNRIFCIDCCEDKVSVNECNSPYCTVSWCGDCYHVHADKCNICTKWYCGDHSYPLKCTLCGIITCKKCEEGYEMRECGTCTNKFCEDCIADNKCKDKDCVLPTKKRKKITTSVVTTTEKKSRTDNDVITFDIHSFMEIYEPELYNRYKYNHGILDYIHTCTNIPLTVIDIIIQYNKDINPIGLIFRTVKDRNNDSKIQKRLCDAYLHESKICNIDTGISINNIKYKEIDQIIHVSGAYLYLSYGDTISRYGFSSEDGLWDGKQTVPFSVEGGYKLGLRVDIVGSTEYFGLVDHFMFNVSGYSLDMTSIIPSNSKKGYSIITLKHDIKYDQWYILYRDLSKVKEYLDGRCGFAYRGSLGLIKDKPSKLKFTRDGYNIPINDVLLFRAWHHSWYDDDNIHVNRVLRLPEEFDD